MNATIGEIGRSRSILLVPSALVFVGLFVLPMLYFFVVSFWQVSLFDLDRTFTVKNYIRTYQEYLAVAGFTFLIAGIIALLTTLVALGFAYAVRFKVGRFGTVLLFGALISLFGGYLAKVYAWKTILGTNGILNTALLNLGVIDEPSTALIFNPGAVVVTLTHYLLPLAILPIYGSLRGVSDLTIEAARDLGSTPIATFFNIILPQCRSGLIASFSFTFLIAAGDYVTPRLVGGPSTTMIGNYIESLFGFRFDWPLGSAMSFSTLFCCVAILAVTSHLLIKAQRR
jgi:spermidine/putrescine transport system permease protein